MISLLGGKSFVLRYGACTVRKDGGMFLVPK